MARTGRPAPAWDAPVTVGLLLWGLYSTVQTVAQARDLPAALSEALGAQGIGPYTQTGVGTAVGWIVVVEAVASLAVAIGFSVPRIRDHRLAFWVPLVAGLVSGFVTVLLISLAVLLDPAYLAAVEHGVR